MPTRLVLIRHGQSLWNAARRWQGHADVPLSELGREQAHETARALAGHRFHGLYASDLQRALETARIVGTPHGLVPMIEPRLRELDIGDWEGLVRPEIEARWPETLARFDAEDPHVRPTGGETFAELEARVREALTDLCARHAADAKLAVVAHGGVLAAVTGRFGHANAEAVELDWPA